MIQRLDAEGCSRTRSIAASFTTAGETLARNIAWRHQLLTDFLTLLLGIDERGSRA